MEFLLGFSFVIYVLVTTMGAIICGKIITNPEYTMLPLLLMFMFDGLGAAIFYFVGIEIVDNIRIFKLGVAAAFAIGTMMRVVMLVYANKSTLSA
jgi:choline-glycine betaine transporter|tara:strand:+ start:137 stop:421 length:285 start_codon:yes stop_codon:yes gene_type:complete